jgi:hypothetical protein
MNIQTLADSLIPMEIERITGWQGPPGAAYNVISEDLCEKGILNADWSLSPLGQQVRDYLENSDGK